jgi:hypothetical protein
VMMSVPRNQVRSTRMGSGVFRMRSNPISIIALPTHAMVAACRSKPTSRSRNSSN